MAVSLYEHNERAYRRAAELMEETGKAAVIHPTGTGKSFIGFKLCKENEGKKVCWLSPSETIFRTQLSNLKKVSNGYVPANIAFYTYAGLMLRSEEEIGKIGADYIILDEFHRCGAKQWGKGVHALLKTHPAARVLGLSATNVRYLDNRRDMADELFEGNIASEMSLGEAISLGILKAPKYVVSMFSCEKELKKYEARAKRAKSRAVRDRAESVLEKLRRALGNAEGLDKIFAKHLKRDGKYIAFCSDAEHMREMAEKAPEWFESFGAPRIYRVYSEDAAAARVFRAFEKDESERLKLLFCIDMLNEGVHVEGVDGVILFRPTVSPIIYKQQIGRALCAGKEDTPLILDIVNNFENLYSVGAIEEEMRAAEGYYRALGEEEEIVRERFEIIDEVRDARKLFDELNDVLTGSWETMYACAKAYYEEHGNLQVERRARTKEGYSLGNWICTQRKVRAGKQFGNLTKERIAKLDEIGMIWESVRDASWKKNFRAAEKYREQKGDLNVPAAYKTETGINLGQWIGNVRTYRKNGIYTNYLTEERIRQLDGLGMIWSQPDYLFERNYAACLSYYRKHGNLNVRADECEDGIRIGAWVRSLRRKAESLSEEQKSRLEEIGMQWESKYETAWRKGCAEAERYKKEHGGAEIPCGYVTAEGFRLGAWVRRQIEKADKLDEEKREKLRGLGIALEKEDGWEKRYAMAKAYFEAHGDLNLPSQYEEDGIWLGRWLNEQKRIYRGEVKGKTLSAEQIGRLEEIGAVWSGKSEAAWEEKYREIKAYQAGRKIEDEKKRKSLNRWLNLQKNYLKEGKLSKERAAKLKEIARASL